MQNPLKKNLLEKFCDTSPHVLLFFVILLICIIYSNTLNSPPVLDDRATFILNPSIYIDNLSFDSFRQIYNGNFGKHRFLPMLSFAVDQLTSQGGIAQFHITNISIHIFATVALYLLVLGLTNTNTGKNSLSFLTPGSFSLFVTALWAIHPVQTNGVTYLVQRMASMAALFYFSALASYIWARIGKNKELKATSWICFILFSICAFFSKENTATLPLAVFIIETIFISPNLPGRLLSNISRNQWLLLALIFMLILPYIATELTIISNQYNIRHFNLSERLFTELRIVVFYLSLLALPLPGRLNLDHDFPVSTSLLNPPMTILSLLLLCVMIFTAFRFCYRRQQPLAAFGLIFFFLNLLIESSIIPLELIFEHRLYLPSPGFFIVIIAFLDWSCRFVSLSDPTDLKKIFFLAILISVSALAISTSLRNNTWRDRLTLYKDIAHKSPLKPRANCNLGMVLLKADQNEEAMAALQKAIALGDGQSEEYLKAADNIVGNFIAQEKFQEAVDQAERLIIERPQVKLNFDGFPMLIANLAKSYWRMGRFNDALEAFRIGINIHHPKYNQFLLGGMEAMLLDASSSEEGRKQLGLTKKEDSIYLKMVESLLLDKDYSNAEIYLAKALNIDPTNKKSLAIKKKITNETTLNRQARKAINLESKPANSTGLYSRSIFALIKFIENKYHLLNFLVEPLLLKAVEIEPESLSSNLKLARRQLQNDNINEALKIVESLFMDNPNSPSLLELAAQCYFVQGENRQAAGMLEKLLEVYPGHPNWKRYKRFIWSYYSARASSQKNPEKNSGVLTLP